MKKIILVSLIAFAINLNAQFTLTKVGTTTQILNNDVFIYNTLNEDRAELKFKINNPNATIIKIKVKCVSITNATGANFQFCFNGTCIATVAANTTYPTDSPFYAEIPAMGNIGNFDHFRNDNPGNGTSVQDYVFKFFQVDDNGTEIGNNSITVTYRYQPVLTTNSFSLDNLGIQLKSTIAENQIEIDSTTENTIMELIDLNGRLLKSIVLSTNNIIDVSNLNANIYLLKFIDATGKTASAKIIKK